MDWGEPVGILAFMASGIGYIALSFVENTVRCSNPLYLPFTLPLIISNGMCNRCIMTATKNKERPNGN